MYTITETSSPEKMLELYEGSALTSEGLIADDENITALINWLKEHGAEPVENVQVYVVKGKTMNEVYGLTGDNAYKDDLSLVAIPLDQLKKCEAIYVERFKLGLRWWDDICDNNQRREEEKAGE